MLFSRKSITLNNEHTDLQKSFIQALEKWKDSWSTYGIQGGTNGPMWIYEREKQFMSQESLDAWKPEMESMEELISTCVRLLKRGYEEGDELKVLDEMENKFQKCHNYALAFFQKYLWKYIVSRTLQEIRIEKESDVNKKKFNREVQEILD